MAELMIVRRWIRSGLMLVGIVFIGTATLAYMQHKEAALSGSRDQFLVSMAIASMLGISWVLLAIYYLIVPRIFNPQRPRRNVPDRTVVLPKWGLVCMGLIVTIGGLVFYILVLSERMMTPHDLLAKNRLAALEGILAADPAVAQKSEPSLLMEAVCAGNNEAVSLLLQYGADLYDFDAEGRGLVIHALLHGAVLDLLLENEAPLDQLDSRGHAAIHYAISLPTMEPLEKLIHAGASINLANGQQLTPLLIAVSSGKLPVVECLLAEQADVDAVDRQGNSALHMAVAVRSPELVALLLEAGAKPIVYNFDEYSPLHLAAKLGLLQIVKQFETVVDPARLVNRRDLSPFDVAVMRRRYEVAEYLLGWGVDVNRVHKNRNTLFHNLLQDKQHMQLDFLIEHGADIDIRGANGKTARELLKEAELNRLIKMADARDGVEEMAETNAVESVTSTKD
jgi:ankyrin repeat protein